MVVALGQLFNGEEKLTVMLGRSAVRTNTPRDIQSGIPVTSLSEMIGYTVDTTVFVSISLKPSLYTCRVMTKYK